MLLASPEPFLGGETRGRSSSLPQHSLPVPPGGRASIQTLLGTRLSSRKCPPFLWSLQSSEFTKPWTTQLTEANPAPNEPNMYMHFIFIHSFTLRDIPSVTNGPGECRGLSPTGPLQRPHLCSKRGQSPQGREQASAPSKAPKGMPICCQGGAPCSYFFLQTIFNRLTLLLTLKSTILQHTHVAHLSKPQECWGTVHAFTPSRHFWGESPDVYFLL